MSNGEFPGVVEEAMPDDATKDNQGSGESLEFKKIRVREKLHANILIGAIGFVLAASVVGYLARETLAFNDYRSAGGYPSNAEKSIYTDYASFDGGGNSAGSYDAAASAGCGGAGGASSASCCGAGGGNGAAGADFAELERQALENYRQEKGSNEEVTAKATDYGCHIQIDILDGQGKVIASYGYQGDSLYRI